MTARTTDSALPSAARERSESRSTAASASAARARPRRPGTWFANPSASASGTEVSPANALSRLVGRLEDLEGSALVVLGVEDLLLAARVVRDQAVRRAADGLRRAVVPLEEDDLAAGVVLLEAEDVLDVGSPPAVDRLVRVA